MEIVGIAIVLCIAGIIQSAAGFAYALFATPLLLIIGMPLPETITIVSICSFIQSSLGAFHLRKSIPWKVSSIAITVRVISIGIGLLILYKLSNQNINDIKFIIGCIICGLVILKLSIKVNVKEKLHWIWGAVSFSGSGILSGLCGMGGPPLVLWTIAHDWPVKKTRGFLFSVFAASIPPQILLLYLTFGNDILYAALTAICYFPAVLLGTKIGMPIGNRLPKSILQKIVYTILIIIGLSSTMPYIHTYLFK
jgi:uncharacterized protein